MSLLKANAVQLGQSLTASQNFTWYQPATPDGTVRLGNGNSGSVTDLVTLTSAGNLGIGTSSPSAKTEISVVSSDATVNQEVLRISTTGRSAGGGTAGRSDLISFYDASNPTLIGAIGGFRTNSNVDYSGGIKFFYNGAAQATAVSSLTLGMTLDSSGNLGLGVTPSAWATYKALQIGPNLAAGFIAGAGNDTYFGDSAYYNAGWKYAYTGVSVSAYRQTAGQHIWYTAPSGTSGNAISFTQAMTLDASGNLNIGTTGVSQKLVVNGGIWSIGPANLGTSAGPGLISYEYPSTRCYIGDGTGYSWKFSRRASSATTDLFTISDSGNVGTSAVPSSFIDVAGWFNVNKITIGNAGGFDIAAYTNNAYYSAAGVWRYIGSAAATQYVQYVGSHRWYSASSGTAGNTVSWISTMIVDTGGNLSIAGASATKASGTTWANPSDTRLKDNQQVYTKGLNELSQIVVKTWEFNGKGGSAKGTKGLGVIADEIERVLPESVDTYSAKLNDDDDNETEIKRFDASEVIWLLVNSVKELSAELNLLKQKVNA